MGACQLEEEARKHVRVQSAAATLVLGLFEHYNHYHRRRREPGRNMDNSPTALFDSYEQDFQQIVSSIREKLEGDAKDERGGKAWPSWMSFGRI